jgi:hypothetical protein
VSRDPDAVGSVTHNLTLRNLDGSWNYTINGSFKSADDSDMWVSFNTSLVPAGQYRMNIFAVADDNPSDTENRTTEENFTIYNSLPSCTTLSTANSNYALIGNVTINDSTCFTVSAANVTIDCYGYTITGNNASGTYGIHASLGSGQVSIKNCNIVDFETGVYVWTCGTKTGYIKDTNITSSNVGIYEYSNDAFCGMAELSGLNVYAHTGSAVFLQTNSYNTMTANSTFKSEHSAVIYADSTAPTGYDAVFANNTFLSGDGDQNLVSLGAPNGGCAVNTLYWNNFTATSGKYINEGGSCLPTIGISVDGHNEGNIYANVIDGTVGAFGTNLSTGYPSLYYGTMGAVPYTSANSGNKIFGSDPAPLTPFTNAAPVVESVSTPSAQDVTPCSTTSLPVMQVNVSDADGYADVNASATYVNISNGAVTHQSATCMEDSHDTNWVLLNCTGASMDFYDVAASDWQLVGDSQDAKDVSASGVSTTNMTYNEGTHMKINNAPILFDTVYKGENDSVNTNSPALNVQNCGNTMLNMTIQGANITDGGSNSIPAGQFRVSDNSVPGVGSELVLTEDAQDYSKSGGQAIGASSTWDLWFFVNMLADQVATAYNQGNWAFVASKA